MIIGITGHRPGKLGWGYNYEHPKWIKVKNIVKEYLKNWGCKEVWVGMALGFDIVVALAVLELKDEGYNIKLNCAVPCRNHYSKWPKKSIDMCNSIMEKADSVVLVTDEDYSPHLMQKRNMYIVDICSKLLALWNGSAGGTGNCLIYAWNQAKDVSIIDPNEI